MHCDSRMVKIKKFAIPNLLRSLVRLFVGDDFAKINRSKTRKDLNKLVRKMEEDKLIKKKIREIIDSIDKGVIGELDGHEAIFDHTDWVKPSWKEQVNKLGIITGWTFFDTDHFYESGGYYCENRSNIWSSFGLSSDEFTWLIKRLEGVWVKL